MKENCMHGFAYVIIATERKRQVAHAATNMCARQMCTYPFGCPDEVESIAVVLFHASGNSKHVRVEDYICRIYAYRLCENIICPAGYLYSTVVCSSLALFVETHHHYGSPIALYVAGTTDEHILTLLQRDGINYSFALQTLQSGNHRRPVAGVNHYWHTRDVRFHGYPVKEVHHFRAGIQKAVVHIYVYHHGPVGHLLTCNSNGLIVFLLLYQAEEFP